MMESPAFVPTGSLPLRSAAATRPVVVGRPRPAAAATAPAARRAARMVTEIGSADKEEVREYFTNTGFGRWNKIYSDDDSVNAVQRDIREGHAKTVDTVRWPGGWGWAARPAVRCGCAREFDCLPLGV